MTSVARHIHVDPLGGVAGDMMIAALLDAFPHYEPVMRDAIAACGLPPGWMLSVEAYGDGVLTGHRFRVCGPAGTDDGTHHHHHHTHDHDHDHGASQGHRHTETYSYSHSHSGAETHTHTHTTVRVESGGVVSEDVFSDASGHDYEDGPDHEHSHSHVHGDGHGHAHVHVHAPHDHAPHNHATGAWRDLKARLEAAPLAPGVRARAIAIFSDIAVAEAQVHGKAVEDVTFHEVADWDSVADVVGAAALFEALGPDTTWSCSPLPLGTGLIETAHGTLPVPAPATALLLQGLPVIDDGISGERVTPTGAALIRHLSPTLQHGPGLFTITGGGIGFGTRRLPGRSNVVRLLVMEPVAKPEASPGGMDQVAVLTFEVDDQTPEDLATGLAHLRRADGVLDVLQVPVFVKKGRLATQIQVLCRPETADAVAACCLDETMTLGVRQQIVPRRILPRRLQGTKVGPVKVTTRPGGGRSAKLEADSQADISGVVRRARRRRVAEAEVLTDQEEPE